MKQFDVCRNLHAATRARAPFLLILQSDLLETVDVRLVAPLVSAQSMTPIKRLNPVFTIEDADYVASMLEMVSLRRRLIGKTVTSLAGERDQIISAIDLIITGV